MSSSSTAHGSDPSASDSSYLSHVSRGFDAVTDAPYLVLVPLATALLGIGRVDDVVASQNAFTLTLGLPSPTPDLWAFLNATPSVGMTDGVVRTIGASDATALLVGVVAQGVLGAGLLRVLAGIIGESERPSFADAVRRHVVPVLAYQVAVGVGVLVLTLLGLASDGNSAVVFVGIVLGLAVLYTVYGTPFIAVTHDYGFRRALGRSVSLCTTGEYALFTVGYALTILVCSPAVSALAYANGISTVVAAMVVAAPVGAVLAGATTSFFASVAE